MVVKYQALLDRMAASDLPETAQYRVDLEKIARYRIKVAMENPDDPDAGTSDRVGSTAWYSVPPAYSAAV